MIIDFHIIDLITSNPQKHNNAGKNQAIQRLKAKVGCSRGTAIIFGLIGNDLWLCQGHQDHWNWEIQGNVQTLYRLINSEELIMYIVIHHIDWDHSVRKGNEYSYEYEDANLNSYSLCNCAQHFVMNA